MVHVNNVQEQCNIIFIYIWYGTCKQCTGTM